MNLCDLDNKLLRYMDETVNHLYHEWDISRAMFLRASILLSESLYLIHTFFHFREDFIKNVFFAALMVFVTETNIRQVKKSAEAYNIQTVISREMPLQRLMRSMAAIIVFLNVLFFIVFDPINLIAAVLLLVWTYGISSLAPSGPRRPKRKVKIGRLAPVSIGSR